MKKTLLLFVIFLVLITTNIVSGKQVYITSKSVPNCELNTTSVMGYTFNYTSIECVRNIFTKQVSFDTKVNVFIIKGSHVISYCENCKTVYLTSYDDLIFDINNSVVYRGNRELLSVIRPEVHSFLFLVTYFNGSKISYVIAFYMYFIYILRYLFTGKLREKIIEEVVVLVLLLLNIYVINFIMDPFSAFVTSFIVNGVLVIAIIIFTYRRE